MPFIEGNGVGWWMFAKGAGAETGKTSDIVFVEGGQEGGDWWGENLAWANATRSAMVVGREVSACEDRGGRVVV